MPAPQHFIKPLLLHRPLTPLRELHILLKGPQKSPRSTHAKIPKINDIRYLSLQEPHIINNKIILISGAPVKL